MQALLYACFFFSGAAGLLYEIYWAQRFGLVLGLDIYSHAAVLTAFMGGLALGSELAAVWADRLRRPWMAYAALEFGIGACGLAIPFLLPLLTDPLRAVYAASGQSFTTMTLVRFGLAVCMLLPPTILMGATLPVMAVALRREQDRLGEIVSRLYVLNTLGAVVGVLAGGFFLGELFGLFNTNLTAVVLNVLATVLALIAGTRGPSYAPGSSPAGAADGTIYAAQAAGASDSALTAASDATIAPAAPDTLLGGSAGVIALGAGLTGAAAMITQIGWTRMVAVSIGSSTYAFSLIVAIFLLGLAIGARRSESHMRKWSDALVPWLTECLAAGILCWLVIILLGKYPSIAGSTLTRLARGSFAPVWLLYIVMGMLTFLLFVLPIVAMGTTFPLACEAYSQRRKRGTARVTGSVYAVNTIGAMLGSAFGGLVGISALGVQNMLRVAGAGYLLAALLGIAAAQPADRRRVLKRVGGGLALGAAVLIGGWLIPWKYDDIMFAKYLLRIPGKGPSTFKMTFYRESPEGTIAVAHSDVEGETTMTLNGKPDASAKGDRPTMLMLGQLPMLLHGSPRDVALIGLGAGISLKSVLTHDIKQVDMIELSQAVVDAVRPPGGGPGPFDAVNGRGLDDPRCNLIIADGRSHLALTDKRYDVIISQPSNPWVAGVSSLFTREYLETCRQRLNAGGLFCLWLQSYTLPSPEFFRVVRTVEGVFPQTSVWSSPIGNDYFVVGVERPHDLTPQLESLLRRPQVRDDLSVVRIGRPADVLGAYVCDAADLKNMGIEKYSDAPWTGIRPNTDDHNFLRYRAAKAIWEPQFGAGYVAVARERRFPWRWTPFSSRPDGDAPPLVARAEDVQDAMYLGVIAEETRNLTYKWAFARGLAALGVDAMVSADWADYVSKVTPRGAGVDEEIRKLSASIAREARDLVAASADASDRETRIRLARNARVSACVCLATLPENLDALGALAEAYYRMGRFDEARARMSAAIAKGAKFSPRVQREIESAR